MRSQDPMISHFTMGIHVSRQIILSDLTEMSVFTIGDISLMDKLLRLKDGLSLKEQSEVFTSSLCYQVAIMR